MDRGEKGNAIRISGRRRFGGDKTTKKSSVRKGAREEGSKETHDHNMAQKRSFGSRKRGASGFSWVMGEKKLGEDMVA